MVGELYVVVYGDDGCAMLWHYVHVCRPTQVRLESISFCVAPTLVQNRVGNASPIAW